MSTSLLERGPDIIGAAFLIFIVVVVARTLLKNRAKSLADFERNRYLRAAQKKPGQTIDVKQCARCGGDHPRLRFERFTVPPTGSAYSHWAPCPHLGEPILLVITAKS